MGNFLQRLSQELDIWTKLRHRNIIPLFGVVYNLGLHASMVSPWMHSGNASKYFETLDTRTTSATRMKVVRLILNTFSDFGCDAVYSSAKSFAG